MSWLCTAEVLTVLSANAPQPLFHRLDLRDPAAIDEVFAKYDKDGGIWAVIHLAALKAVGESGEKPLDYYKVNVGGSIALMEVSSPFCLGSKPDLTQSMAKHNCKNLVFSSSATVYGTPKIIPIPETSPLVPESVYGRTKAMVEMIMQDACRAAVLSSGDMGLRAVSVRYFNPAGAYPSGKLGEEPRGKPGNLLPLLAQMASGRDKSALKVFGDDYPTP